MKLNWVKIKLKCYQNQGKIGLKMMIKWIKSLNHMDQNEAKNGSSEDKMYPNDHKETK